MYGNEEKLTLNRENQHDSGAFRGQIAVEPNWRRIGDLMSLWSHPLRFDERRPTAPL